MRTKLGPNITQLSSTACETATTVLFHYIKYRKKPNMILVNFQHLKKPLIVYEHTSLGA